MVAKKNKMVNWKKDNMGALSKLKHTFEGLMYGLRERATVTDYIVLFILNTLSILFVPGIMEKGELITMGFIFLGTEYLNTAIETTVDRIGLEYHILSKYAKDLASGASFLIITGLVILIFFSILNTIQYYREWRKINPNGNILDFIISTWTYRKIVT